MKFPFPSAMLLLLALLIAAPGASAAQGAVPSVLPVPEMVTLVDLGASSCIPCKMMAPILEEVGKEYEGRAAVVFIDVWQHPDQARRFKVSMIPTQIFFDRSGREVYRHSGFMDKKTMVEQLTKLLAE
jgi:thioredoxin 1